MAEQGVYDQRCRHLSLDGTRGQLPLTEARGWMDSHWYLSNEKKARGRLRLYRGWKTSQLYTYKLYVYIYICICIYIYIHIFFFCRECRDYTEPLWGSIWNDQDSMKCHKGFFHDSLGITGELSLSKKNDWKYLKMKWQWLWCLCGVSHHDLYNCFLFVSRLNLLASTL